MVVLKGEADSFVQGHAHGRSLWNGGGGRSNRSRRGILLGQHADRQGQKRGGPCHSFPHFGTPLKSHAIGTGRCSYRGTDEMENGRRTTERAAREERLRAKLLSRSEKFRENFEPAQDGDYGQRQSLSSNGRASRGAKLARMRTSGP